MKRKIIQDLGSALLMIGLIGVACNRNASEPMRGSEQRFADREGWNASIRITEAGRLSAIIEYGHMTYYDADKMNYFNEGVRVDIFDEFGKHTTMLTSDSAQYDEATQNICAIGNVEVVSDTGITLKTSVLRWDQNSEKIVSDTRVMVTTLDHDTIYGTAMESKPDLSHMRIDNPTGSSMESIDFLRLEKQFKEEEKVAE